MSGFIKGGDCILRVNVLGDYLPLVCAKSFGCTVTADTVETTTQGTGQFKSYDYDALSYTLDFDGVLKVQDDQSRPLVFDMLAAQLSFIAVGWKLLFVDPDGVPKQLAGTSIITSTQLTAAVADPAGGTLQLQGSGELVLSDPASSCDIVINAIELVGAGGSQTIGSGGIHLVPIDGPFTVNIQYTGGPPFRFDWILDGGATNTTFTSSFELAIVNGTHTLTIIPYCDGGATGETFETEFTAGAPE